MTSRELPSVRSWVRLAISALGVMLPMRLVSTMGTGIAEAAEAQDLGADEDQVPIGQAVRCFEEDPGAIAAPQVADIEPPFFPRELGVQGREKLIF